MLLGLFFMLSQNIRSYCIIFSLPLCRFYRR